jgi:lipid-binding SYLF domain-containing protein
MKSTKKIKQWTALVLGLATVNVGIAQAADRGLDKRAMSTLDQCRQISSSCASTTQDSVGVLVFPSVIKADLIIGGAGGKGVLIENGKVTGYYNIGAGSAGLQAGIDRASQVYVFRTAEALNQLKSGQDWKVGANAGVTLVTADANAQASTGDILAYVFKSKGLEAGVALDIFDVWKSDDDRPSQG